MGDACVGIPLLLCRHPHFQLAHPAPSSLTDKPNIGACSSLPTNPQQPLLEKYRDNAPGDIEDALGGAAEEERGAVGVDRAVVEALRLQPGRDCVCV